MLVIPLRDERLGGDNGSDGDNNTCHPDKASFDFWKFGSWDPSASRISCQGNSEDRPFLRISGLPVDCQRYYNTGNKCREQIIGNNDFDFRTETGRKNQKLGGDKKRAREGGITGTSNEGIAYD